MNYVKPQKPLIQDGKGIYPITTIDQVVRADGRRFSEKEFNRVFQRNLFRPTLPTTTKNGVTCTNNGDGTFTLNGTANANTKLRLNSINLNSNIKYKFLGVLATGNPFTYGIRIGNSDNDNSFVEEVFKDGVILNGGNYVLDIDINNGTALNNVVVKPMITDDLSTTYDDFVSYDDSLVTGSNQYFFGGIDKDRVLATFTNNGTYTATEDCWAYIYQPNFSAYVHIGGMIFKVHGHGDGTDSHGIFPMKKGMEIWVESSSGVSITVYGIKG